MKVSVTVPKKVSLTVVALGAAMLSGCFTDREFVPVAAPDIAVPQIKEAMTEMKLPLACPKMPRKPPADATMGQMAAWAMKMSRNYPMCTERNDEKTRMIMREPSLGGQQTRN